jgi:molybdopterin converting factor small subunit
MPGADRLPPEPLVAVNERYARRDHVLVAGDEVAIIPPVAGG